MMNQILAWLTWDPPRFIFTVPIINRPVAWYGLFFVSGFIVGFFLMLQMFKRKLRMTRPELGEDKIKELAVYLTDKLTWFTIIGTVVGARLGHVIFYDWPRYQNNLVDIFKVWEGGLASHGGVIGISIALIFFLRSVKKDFPEINYLTIIDFLGICGAFAACCIRIGNFFNQEILGPVTNVPWAIVFGHPYDGSPPLPRHPVQLYEAATYLVIFGILYTIWSRKYEKLKQGTLTGLFFVLIFGARFFLEFFKIPDSLVFDETTLLASQWLSLPFIALGVYFLVLRRWTRWT